MTHGDYIAYNVEKEDGKWVVKKDDASQPSKTASTEAKAISKAKKLANKNAPAEVRVRTSRSGSQHSEGEWRSVHAYHDTHRTVYNVQEAHRSDNNWEVRKEGADRASKTGSTEREVLKKAKKLAKKNKPSEVRVRTSRSGSVHSAGQWRAEYTYE